MSSSSSVSGAGVSGTLVKKKVSEEKLERKEVVRKTGIDPNIVVVAMQLLDNNRKEVITKSGEVELKSWQHDVDLIKAVKGMFPTDFHCKFRLTRTGPLVNGTNSLFVNLTTNLTAYSEGSSLTILFDECKMVKTQLRVALVRNTTQFAYALGFEPIAVTATQSAVLVLRLSNSKILSTYWANPEVTSLMANTKGYIWGATAAESTSAGIIRAGCNGTFFVYDTQVAANLPTTGETSFAYHMSTVAEFRTRA